MQPNKLIDLAVDLAVEGSEGSGMIARSYLQLARKINPNVPLTDMLDAQYWKAADKAVLETYKGYDGSVTPSICNCCWLPFYPGVEGTKMMSVQHCVTCFYDVHNDLDTPMGLPKIEEIIGGDNDDQL